MKATLILIAVTLLFHVNLGYGQLQNSIWHFGLGNIVKFSSTGPLNVDSVAAGSGEGTYCQADSSGLLFYTNGPYIFDKTYNILENGSDIYCDWFGGWPNDPLLQGGTTCA